MSKITLRFFLSHVCQIDCEGVDGDWQVHWRPSSVLSRLIFGSFINEEMSESQSKILGAT